MKKLFLVYIGTLIVHLVAFLAIYYFFETTRRSFIKEDRFLENLTALLFLLSVLIGGTSFVLIPHKLRNFLYGLIPVVGLVGFLDEISLGERSIKYRAPVMQRVKVDSAHDLLTVFDRFITPYSPIPRFDSLILFVLVGFIWITFLWISRKRYPALLFLIPVLPLLLTGTYIDFRDHMKIHLGKVNIRIFVEELCEMNAALCVFFAALALVVIRKKNGKFLSARKTRGAQFS